MYEYKCKHCKRYKKNLYKNGYYCNKQHKIINHRCTNFWHLECRNFTLNLLHRFLDWLDEKTT